MPIANVLTTQQEIEDFVTNSYRPHKFDQYGRPYDRDGNLLVSNEQLRSNAYLSREEWESLDVQVIAMARQQLNAWADVEARGLTTPGSLAEWSSKWRVSSERREADVTMDFETQTEEDRTEKKTYSVPIPIISAKFSIGRRELLTARAHGTPIETDESEEASSAVTEKAENILIGGNTSIVVQGSSIPGYTTLSARYSGSAEGDFGTIDNIYPTFTGVLTTMHNRRYHGPFDVYVNATQYGEMLARYSDGTGQSALQRVEELPDIRSVKVNDLITDGEIVGVQLARRVVDIREAMALQTRQWRHPSGDRLFFVVVMAAAPRLKTDYQGYTGIFHLSGA